MRSKSDCGSFQPRYRNALSVHKVTWLLNDSQGLNPGYISLRPSAFFHCPLSTIKVTSALSYFPKNDGTTNRQALDSSMHKLDTTQQLLPPTTS